MARPDSNNPWVIVSFLLVMVSAATLIVGLYQDGIGWIWLAMTSSFAAMGALGVGVVQRRRGGDGQPQDSGPRPPPSGSSPPPGDNEQHESRSRHTPPGRPRAEAPDLYAVLGVEPTASQDEIRRAYRLRARLLHPDRHGDAGDDVYAEAQREMTRLNEAWQVLGDPRQRDAYDRSRSTSG